MKTLLLKVLLLVVLVLPVTAQTALNFEITDGKDKHNVLQMKAQKSATADGISVTQSYAPTQKNRPETWIFTIKNNGATDRWLYLNWETIWNSKDVNNLHYWSGKDAPVTGAALLQTPSSDVSLNTSMLQAIYNDKNGLALALPPDQIISQFEQSLQSGAGNELNLRLQIPLVLDAGQSDTFPIEVYRFTPRYGFLDALQQYYAAHPAAFTARTNIDPRAAGVGGSRPYLALAEGAPLRAFEETRRYGGDWEWFYAQFRRTGDIYVREKFWDFKPARPFNSYRSLASAKVFRDTRHRTLEEINAAGAATAFYVPAFLYAEEQLAEQEYSGAIIRKPDGSYWRHYKTPWVTYSDNEILMYPWGNKFAQQSMKDARQLVAENNVPAFGYDIMAGGALFRGEGMKQSPRRAFDADGKYVDSAVAIAKMADFTRSLENNGRKVGLVGNITNEGRPFLVTRSDTLMAEQPAYFYPEALTALRYAAGHKMITIWSAWRLPDLLKTDEMTPEQLREAYQGAADYTRLAAYRYGAYPSAMWHNGVPEITRMSTQLKEVIAQGWQAVPAVRAATGVLPASIWTARYGTGLGSFITLGNAEKTAWDGQIVIDNDYLGNSNYLFVGADGKPLAQTVRGRTTAVQVQIPAKETLVLRAVAAVPATAPGAATVAWKDNGASGVLNVEGALPAVGVLPPRSGWSAPTRAGQNWNFQSKYFASPVAELREFPFFDETRTAQIVLPEKPSADEEWVAQRLHDYFVFWGKEELTPAREIELSIVRGEKNADATRPKIIIGGTAKTIRCAGNTLFVGGDSIRETALQLMAALDEKYFYTGTLPAKGRDAEALKKAGLAGKALS
jgi:hypothetical protein